MTMAHDKRNDGFNYRAAVELIRPELAARLWPADDLPLFAERNGQPEHLQRDALAERRPGQGLTRSAVARDRVTRPQGGDMTDDSNDERKATPLELARMEQSIERQFHDIIRDFEQRLAQAATPEERDEIHAERRWVAQQIRSLETPLTESFRARTRT